MGLIGWGANARALTQRLVAANARVIVYTDHGSAEDIRSWKAEPAPLAGVLTADIVSVHRGLTPATAIVSARQSLRCCAPASAYQRGARGVD